MIARAYPKQGKQIQEESRGKGGNDDPSKMNSNGTSAPRPLRPTKHAKQKDKESQGQSSAYDKDGNFIPLQKRSTFQPNRYLKVKQEGGRVNHYIKERPVGGNPHVAIISKHRGAILDSFTAEQTVAVMRAVWRKAVRGNIAAARVYFDRVIGRVPMDLEALLVSKSNIQAEMKFL